MFGLVDDTIVYIESSKESTDVNYKNWLLNRKINLKIVFPCTSNKQKIKQFKDIIYNNIKNIQKMRLTKYMDYVLL